MTEHRLPLQSLNGNVIASPTPAASSSRSVVKKAIKLAPIFTRSYSTPSSSQLRSDNASSSTQAQTPSSPTRNSSRKRQRRLGPVAQVLPDSPSSSSREDVKMSGSEDEEDEEIAEADDRRRLKHGRVVSMHDYFPTTPSSRPDGHHLDGKNHRIRKSVIAIPEVKVDTGLWRRKRGRMGIPARGSMMMSGPTQITTPTTPYLERLVTSLSHRSTEPPSLILIPSLHPWQQPRDFAPPLTVAFSNSAKRYSSRDAKEAGVRRFVAVAAEEGGVRVVDVDEPVGENRDVGGWFWRAHGNAVLDLKWSRNDTHILTASGDQTARLHVMDGETPRLLSTLSSHSASLKSCTFLDTSRSSVPFENAVATAGRDGNILIFDVRGPDKMITDDHTLTVDAVPTQGRTRGGYSAGVPGFEPQFSDGTHFWKFRMANAHGDSPRKKNQMRSVTSLVALQSMPGYLASAGSADGIVKLWDPRFQQKTQPQAVASLPDPTAVNGARPRGIHALCEQPSTGDLHVLTGDSKIHVVRPSLNVAGDNSDLIQPVRYVHPELRSNFWMGISFSPCGRYLASGSTKGGVMTWDTASQARSVRGSVNEVVATRLNFGEFCDGREREVNAVDWGYDMLAACADDFATRIWREDAEAARSLKCDPAKAGQDWAGVVV